MENELQQKSEMLANLKSRKEELEDRLKLIEVDIKSVSDSLLQLMKNADLQRFTTANGTFFINTGERARIVDPVKAFEFLRANGCGDVIKETVHAQTLSSVYKELREAGKIDVFSAEQVGISVFMDESVRIRKQ